MKLEEAKQELIKRYQYLYENASFILAPYMMEETDEHLEIYNHEMERRYQNNYRKRTEKNITLIIPPASLNLFEQFLLSDTKMEDSELYQHIERSKNDHQYLEKVKQGLLLLKRLNDKTEYYPIKLDFFTLLNYIWDYIENQSGDLENKQNKLDILDEYYRILRYKNDGKIRVSGKHAHIFEYSSIYVSMRKQNPNRSKNDIGVTNNSFIECLTKAPRNDNNYSKFTEKEKQQVYLQYHSELPHDLKTICMEDKTDLKRPDITNPCGKEFIIKEDQIFIYNKQFYQLCSNCGYIVNIKEELIPNEIKERIKNRCQKDSNLFRKMILYTELKQLDDIEIEGQIKLLTKSKK